MKIIKVYDLPTRLFHWGFAFLFLAAFLIAQVFDEDSAWYPYHMMAGLVLVLMVVFRILWGFFGSRYARFSSFPLSPSQILTYFKSVFFSKTERHPGHNPASAWAALLMMGLTFGLGFTGYRMTQNGGSDFFEEAHELLAYAFLLVVVAHVAGVVLHTLRHRDGLPLSMVHGHKAAVGEASGIARSHVFVGFLFLALIGGFIFHLNQNYNPTSRTLTLWGKTLNLGESENEGNEDQGEQREEKETNEHDD